MDFRCQRFTIICLFLVFRENHHLLLQVSPHGRFQRNASGAKLYRFQLLPQVLRGRGEGGPTNRRKCRGATNWWDLWSDPYSKKVTDLFLKYFYILIFASCWDATVLTTAPCCRLGNPEQWAKNNWMSYLFGKKKSFTGMFISPVCHVSPKFHAIAYYI